MEFRLSEAIQAGNFDEFSSYAQSIHMQPDMSVVRSDTGIVFRGKLFFYATPVNASDGAVPDWRHEIPVEISLPEDRVPNPDRLSIEANQLSLARDELGQMLLTGIMVLKGIGEAANQVETPLPQEQEIVYELPEVETREEAVAATVVPTENHLQTLEIHTQTPERAPVVETASPHWSDWLTTTCSGSEGTYKIRLVIVKENEHLSDWARKYDVSPRVIMYQNRLENEQLQAGQFLRIP